MFVVVVDMYVYVFYDFQYWYFYFFEYYDVFFGVDQCDVLWCGDYYCVGYWNVLCQGQLDVVGVWWYIQYQVIKIWLQGFLQYLYQCFVGYWFMLDYGVVVGYQVVDGVGCQIIFYDWCYMGVVW